MALEKDLGRGFQTLIQEVFKKARKLLAICNFERLMKEALFYGPGVSVFFLFFSLGCVSSRLRDVARIQSASEGTSKDWIWLPSNEQLRGMSCMGHQSGHAWLQA